MEIRFRKFDSEKKPPERKRRTVSETRVDRTSKKKKRTLTTTLSFVLIDVEFYLLFIFFDYVVCQVASYPNWQSRLPTTSELADEERTLLKQPIKEGLNSVPTTQREKTDCAIQLLPSQLFKVVVGNNSFFTCSMSMMCSLLLSSFVRH
jgi:hypothetical protein